MSYHDSSLRSHLQRIDMSAPAIQGAAGAMMKHYDKSPGVAVGEWRNALIQARGDQYLPLLYVANEVLQNSKRNRGNKFLEAFSPVLGQSLIFVCGKSEHSAVESIRRTVKIWAERRVFSIRYVNELIKGLEPYRSGKKQSSSSRTGAIEDQGNQSPGGSRFSPVTAPPTNSPTKNKDDSDTEMKNANDDQDDGIFGGKSGRDDDSDSGDDLFGSTPGNKLLKIDVDFDGASSGGSSKKRRRSSNDPAGSETTGVSKLKSKAKRRNSVQHLSASSLMELMNQVSTQQAKFDRVMDKIRNVRERYGDSSDVKGIDTLVGNELLEEYKKTLKIEEEIDGYKRELHAIAQARRGLEVEALRYIPWLERALKQDKDDIDFSNTFRKQLQLFRGVHKPTKDARALRLREEAARLEKEEERRKKQREEEENKKFMESAIAKQTEAQPGMVWNRATGEYQHLNQEESWRD
eukprot:CAMPEP_0197196114 /NCGR_PEP_ID=MMETSP1423-20130617/32181_1 /TAXON_ID=476441 /ORGANISM="Pseudo-nitzschia heimii, Strain UNC1101" /LENGTH=462 /DNA_ID=CAMNT_0042649887 /DNA_START=530 /DNA_END=1918 /DNA_ORIENTATION=+